MRSKFFKVALIKSGLAASALLLAGTASAQSTVSLTAAPQNGVMPDGTVVPMWGLSCGNNAALNATATAVLSGTTVGSITVNTAGSGYTTAPAVTLSGPPAGGTQATATATLTNGAVSGFTITSAGAGYTSAPTVTIGWPPWRIHEPITAVTGWPLISSSDAQRSAVTVFAYAWDAR